MPEEGGLVAAARSLEDDSSYDDSYERLSHSRPQQPSHALRLRLMMTNYRAARTLGVLENKLLASTALTRLGLPAMEVVYGGFAYTRLGEWPAYSRAELCAVLARGGFGPRRGFVAKPASDGTNYGLLVMTPERWRRENWTEALVATMVERFLFKGRSSWGQWYEQRGVVVQSLYTEGAPRGLRWPHGLAEMNVLAHLGEPVHMRVQEIPKAKGAGCFDVRLHANGSHDCLPTPNCPNPQLTCRKYTLQFARSLPEVRAYVRRLASFFGADWFRFDYFGGHPHRMLRVNEVSYPSHHTYPSDLREAWLAAYLRSVVDEPANANSNANSNAKPRGEGAGTNAAGVAAAPTLRPMSTALPMPTGRVAAVATGGVAQVAGAAAAAPNSSTPVTMLEVPAECVMRCARAGHPADSALRLGRLLVPRTLTAPRRSLSRAGLCSTSLGSTPRPLTTSASSAARRRPARRPHHPLRPHRPRSHPRHPRRRPRPARAKGHRPHDRIARCRRDAGPADRRKAGSVERSDAEQLGRRGSLESQ
jgi:hypothetical protein|eukprot:jgi/Chrpa1/9860/Chrysochromulina_OHIO_Genome00017965-RA